MTAIERVHMAEKTDTTIGGVWNAEKKACLTDWTGDSMTAMFVLEDLIVKVLLDLTEGDVEKAVFLAEIALPDNIISKLERREKK